TVAVTVEAGVTLDSLELRPGSSTLRNAGATVDLTLLGHFSNGDARDLTGDPGASFQSSDAAVATIAGARATAAAGGGATIVGRLDALSASALVRVAISSGSGFLRGEAFDDSRGLPLGGVTATLVADGGGPLAAPVSVVADDRGRFVVPGRAGDAVVRISRAGF